MRLSGSLSDVDPEIATAVENEYERQSETLDLIASENHVSQAVLEAQGSVLTNKYAEGYPGERYYGGCEYVDEVENLAIERAKNLFGADHVNVQPHSGSQANMGVYFATLDPGDKILSLDLTHGGHLTHGHPANFTGSLYDIEHYEIDPETGYIDYDDLDDVARSFDPDMIVSGFSAYPRAVEWDRIQDSADSVDALHLADISHITGLVAADIHPSPVGVADFVSASTHKTIRAGRGGMIMCDETYADAIDKAVFPGEQGGPLMHNIAGKAVGFKEALQPEFDAYAEQIVTNARALADVFTDAGLTLVSGGTDTHLVLVDLRDSHPDLTGRDAETALESVNLITNKNTVPEETRSPSVTSGLRVGTPALTTRGFDETGIREVANLIIEVLDAPEDESVRSRVREDVAELCASHPVPSTR